MGPNWFLSAAVQEWLKEKHVDTHYIEPGSPVAECILRKFQFNIPNHLSESVAGSVR